MGTDRKINGWRFARFESVMAASFNRNLAVTCESRANSAEITISCFVFRQTNDRSAATNWNVHEHGVMHVSLAKESPHVGIDRY